MPCDSSPAYFEILGPPTVVLKETHMRQGMRWLVVHPAIVTFTLSIYIQAHDKEELANKVTWPTSSCPSRSLQGSHLSSSSRDTVATRGYRDVVDACLVNAEGSHVEH